VPLGSRVAIISLQLIIRVIDYSLSSIYDPQLMIRKAYDHPPICKVFLCLTVLKGAMVCMCSRCRQLLREGQFRVFLVLCSCLILSGKYQGHLNCNLSSDYSTFAIARMSSETIELGVWGLYKGRSPYNRYGSYYGLYLPEPYIPMACFYKCHR
jgi:hypothetical protein